MRKQWKPQDTISVRIPKDVDPGLLRWIEDLHEKRILQSTVMEALHRLYYDDRGRDTMVLPIAATRVIDRSMLGRVLLGEHDRALSGQATTDSVIVQTPVKSETTDTEVIVETDDAATESARVEETNAQGVPEDTRDNSMNTERSSIMDALIFNALQDL